MQDRNKKGHFENKSDTERKVRSIRATDNVWENFGNMANQLGITRADLLEKIANDIRVLQGIINEDKNTQLLEEALKLKANAGGAIKRKIREYLKSIYP